MALNLKPSEREQNIFFNCLDFYHKSSDSSEVQYISRRLKKMFCSPSQGFMVQGRCQTLDSQPSTLNPQPSTLNPPNSKLNTKHQTPNTKHQTPSTKYQTPNPNPVTPNATANPRLQPQWVCDFRPAYFLFFFFITLQPRVE